MIVAAFLYSCSPGNNKKLDISSAEVLENTLAVLEKQNNRLASTIILNSSKYDKSSQGKHKNRINALVRIRTGFLEEVKSKKLSKEKLYQSVLKTRAELIRYGQSIGEDFKHSRDANIFKDEIYISDDNLQEMALLTNIELELMVHNCLYIIGDNIPMDFDPCRGLCPCK